MRNITITFEQTEGPLSDRSTKRLSVSGESLADTMTAFRDAVDVVAPDKDEPAGEIMVGALDLGGLTVTGPEWEEVARDDLKSGDEVRVKFPSWERYEERGVLHTRRTDSLWLNKDGDYVIDTNAMYSSLQRKVK
jgi:hypothetical protein